VPQKKIRKLTTRMQERRFSRISFDNSRYEQLAVVRNSIFGEILLCLDTQTQEEVIIKTIDLSLAYKKQSKTNEAVYENVIKEIDVMSQLSSLGGHRNVIKMRSYFVEQQGTHLYIVLDYCEGGDLLEHCIHGSTDMPVRQLGEKDVLMYLSDVLHGLHFLHINGIAHRDLSLENILIHQGRAVI
jgi:serine/threonine protein kinase